MKTMMLLHYEFKINFYILLFNNYIIANILFKKNKLNSFAIKLVSFFEEITIGDRKNCVPKRFQYNYS